MGLLMAFSKIGCRAHPYNYCSLDGTFDSMLYWRLCRTNRVCFQIYPCFNY